MGKLPYEHMRLAGAPELPPNPTRRRHAFKLATAWLVAVAALFAAGAATAALVLGFALVAACSVVTVANFCIPSELLALAERRRSAQSGYSSLRQSRGSSGWGLGVRSSRKL